MILSIKSHPLQEQCVDTFVPNDSFVIGGCGVGSESMGLAEDIPSNSLYERNSVVICTGANACKLYYAVSLRIFIETYLEP